MKRFTPRFPKKSNRYIPLWILLLFFLLPTTLYAMEDATLPIDTVPPTTEDSNIELPSLEPPSTEIPEDTFTEEISTPSTPSQEDFIIEPFEGIYYITSSGGLNVRLGPSIQYDIIGSLPYGQEIAVTGKIADDWFQIHFQGESGYISAKYVSTEPVSIIPIETEEIIEEPETIIEESPITQDVSPFFSDTTVILLLIAILATTLVIIITIISFFRNNHKHDYEEYYDYDDNENQKNS